MEPLGIMLCGYGRDKADFIRTCLTSSLGRDIISIGASGRENLTVGEIIEGGGPGRHEEGGTRVLMFLGFTDDEISRAMDAFPKGGEVERPIFCGLTEENIGWRLNFLLEHLSEEHRRWIKSSQ